MKLFKIFAAALLLLAGGQMQAQSLSPTTKWHWQEGQIVIDTPARPAGQQSALGLTVAPIKNVRVAFIGLGARGPYAVRRWTNIRGIEVVGLCDVRKEKVEMSQKDLRDAGLPPAALYWGKEGYKELCERDDVDLIYIVTDWYHHFPIAKYALEHGKNVACEVPAAMNLEQCWELINLSEKNRLHMMMLENCCYDWYEMTALNMAQQGVFGEVLTCAGAYIHYLGRGLSGYWKDGPDDKMSWRLRYNKESRGDIYATHGLGPVAEVLNIHRGDRFKTLVAMDTKPVFGPEYVQELGESPDFRNGDVTQTLMKTENGKMVEIVHSVVTPRPYNRMFQVVGSKGYANKYPKEQFAFSAERMNEIGVTPSNPNQQSHDFLPEADYKKMMAKYVNPISKRYEEEAKRVGGHGGMDFIMDSRLAYCLQNGLPLDQDVYDLAEWCGVAELSALSLDHNSASVQFPDFTRGEWDKVKGFRHAMAEPEADKANAALADQITQFQKDAAEKAWTAYDKAKDDAARNAVALKTQAQIKKQVDKLLK